jgi:hypothetical protein
MVRSGARGPAHRDDVDDACSGDREDLRRRFADPQLERDRRSLDAYCERNASA